MAENEDGQEKSQEPTARRLQQAREKGQVARSRELTTLAVTLGGATALLFMGPWFGSTVNDIFAANFTLSRQDVLDPTALLRHLKDAVAASLLMLAPFFALMMVIAVLASIALGGFNFSTQALAPKLEKLDPIKGMKRIFSPNSVMELIKSLGKFVIISGVTALLIWAWLGDLLALGRMPLGPALSEGIALVAWASLILAASLIVMALIDVPFQLWNHTRQLRMTQQEVRDDLKETEGRPEVKGRIRQVQREIAMRRMMAEVPKADVIVTNPTHYAVALRYDQGKHRAPVVVAKGADLVAGNIRRIGSAHKIPIVEAPVLARAVYYSTDIDHPIPAGLYLAVAQLLAYVFQVRVWEKEGGDYPQQPAEFPVPEDLQHD
jgi:flagellar biosynthetic protein FlhB